MCDETDRIASVTLDDRGIVRYNPDVARERAVAIYDLVEDNRFRLLDAVGPYALHLAAQDNRLVFDIRCADGAPLRKVTLPLTPFRKTIKDYFTVCESYYEAIRSATPSQIEAFDMGRRGLHNEASERLQARLASDIEIDFNTARRLFTLICVLHIRS